AQGATCAAGSEAGPFYASPGRAGLAQDHAPGLVELAKPVMPYATRVLEPVAIQCDEFAVEDPGFPAFVVQLRLQPDPRTAPAGQHAQESVPSPVQSGRSGEVAGDRRRIVHAAVLDDDTAGQA